MESSLEQDNDKPSEETENGELLGAVNAAIRFIQEQLNKTGGEKGSVSDLVRLLQLRKELEKDRPRKVNARWIDECKISID